jgi:hypothetical protein
MASNNTQCLAETQQRGWLSARICENGVLEALAGPDNSRLINFIPRGRRILVPPMFFFFAKTVLLHIYKFPKQLACGCSPKRG